MAPPSRATGEEKLETSSPAKPDGLVSYDTFTGVIRRGNQYGQPDRTSPPNSTPSTSNNKGNGKSYFGQKTNYGALTSKGGLEYGSTQGNSPSRLESKP